MRRTSGLVLALLLTSGCHYYFGDDDDPGGGGDDVTDDGSDGDGTGDGFDAGPGEPDAPPVCDPIALLPEGYRPVARVSEGAVTSEPDPERPGVFTTTVDASAGGAAGQAEQPFVYLDLEAEGGAGKVEIDDVASFESTEWDIALKRFVIRSNSGDSGPADAEVASVSSDELTFDDDVPSDRFADDSWSGDDCVLEQANGGPRTRFTNWYRVEAGRFEAQPVVHLVRLGGGRYAEIDVLTYYGDEADPDRSGVYVLHWRRFP